MHFKSSTYQAVIDAYPEYSWYPWLFEKSTRGFWKKTAHHRMYIDWLAEQLGMEYQEDLYRLRIEDFQIDGQSVLLYHRGSHVNAITTVYPGTFEISLKLC